MHGNCIMTNHAAHTYSYSHTHRHDWSLHHLPIVFVQNVSISELRAPHLCCQANRPRKDCRRPRNEPTVVNARFWTHNGTIVAPLLATLPIKVHTKSETTRYIQLFRNSVDTQKRRQKTWTERNETVCVASCARLTVQQSSPRLELQGT